MWQHDEFFEDFLVGQPTLPRVCLFRWGFCVLLLDVLYVRNAAWLESKSDAFDVHQWVYCTSQKPKEGMVMRVKEKMGSKPRIPRPDRNRGTVGRVVFLVGSPFLEQYQVASPQRVEHFLIYCCSSMLRVPLLQKKIWPLLAGSVETIQVLILIVLSGKCILPRLPPNHSEATSPRDRERSNLFAIGCASVRVFLGSPNPIQYWHMDVSKNRAIPKWMVYNS